MTFGERIAIERKKRKISTKTLAELCNLSRSYITLIENNKRLPGKKAIQQIAKGLNLSSSTVIKWYLEEIGNRLVED